MATRKIGNRELDRELADIITARPHDFSVGRKHLRLFPVTLAKKCKLQPYLDAIGANTKALMMNPYLEALRIVSGHRRECCSILAIHTAPNTYKDLHDKQSLAVRRNLINKLSDGDLSALMIEVLMADKTEQVIAHLGLDREHERVRKVMAVKKGSKNNLTFGGLTIFGSFIGPLKEIGYSDDEILFERPYSFLRLMLADKMTSIYLSDDELQGVSEEDGGTMIDGNDPDSFGKLKSMLKRVKFN